MACEAKEKKAEKVGEDQKVLQIGEKAKKVELETKKALEQDCVKDGKVLEDEKQMKESGLKPILPKRRPTGGGGKPRKLKISTKNSLQPKTNDQTQLEWPAVTFFTSLTIMVQPLI